MAENAPHWLARKSEADVRMVMATARQNMELFQLVARTSRSVKRAASYRKAAALEARRADEAQAWLDSRQRP